MGLGQWVRQPQNIWLRRALFQIHLWAGIGVGLYVVAICVSGSAVVFNPELSQVLQRDPITVEITGEPLSEDALKGAAGQFYPNPASIQIWERKSPIDAVEIWIGDEDGAITQRLFNPYTGADLGHPIPPLLRLSMWFVDFHDNLAYGETGRMINGIGSGFLVILCITGMVIWWPGVRNWYRSLLIDWKANRKRLNWSLHSAIGFWTFLLIFMWAISGVYLAFPNPFAAAVDYLQPSEEYAEEDAGTRFGDEVLRLATRIHFGRAYGWQIKAIWVVLGLAPPVLFVTGAIMWWNRVLSPAARQLKKSGQKPAPESVLV